MEKKSSKKTMGRRKIEIKKIEKKASLQVTFTKRRRGLFRKASELAILCGAKVAIVVQSPAEKVFTFGDPSVEAVISITSSAAFRGQIIRHGDDGRSKYEEAMKMLEVEKSRLTLMNKETMGGGFWWEEPFEGMELHELEEFFQALEGLRNNVAGRLEEYSKKFAALSIQGQDLSTQQVCAADSAASSYLLQAQPSDQDQDISIQQFYAANSASSYLLHGRQPFDQDQDISIQQFCAADSASSYLLQAQPFDQDQDIFDVLMNNINRY